ncbi:unnamed protein product, partial [Amoebophrya sp. A120]|eukprot:GSA120T00006850001.1
MGSRFIASAPRRRTLTTYHGFICFGFQCTIIYSREEGTDIFADIIAVLFCKEKMEMKHKQA